MNQAPQEPEFETLTVRLTREMADQFRVVAASQERPVANLLRRLIRQCIDEERAAA
jgi:predicted DNA-binding protein